DTSLEAFQLAAGRDAERALNTLIVLEFKPKCGRGIRLVVGQRQQRAVSAGGDVGEQGKLARKLIARIAAPDDEHAEAIDVVAILFRGKSLDRDRSRFARVAEKSPQECKLLLHLRVF